jgi:hypothetical protein
MFRIISISQLIILPAGYVGYLREITTLKPNSDQSEIVVSLIEEFQNE